MPRIRPSKQALGATPAPPSNTTQPQPARRQLQRHASTGIGSTPAPPTYERFSTRAREMAREGLEEIYAMATDENADRWLRLSCWRVLLEYGWGKPKQTVVADVAHSFVLRAPEVMLDASEWEAKWKDQLTDNVAPGPPLGASKPDP